MMQYCDLHEVSIDRKGCPWCLIENLEEKLSRYESGIEVEGTIRVYDDEVHIESNVHEYPVGHGLDIGQRVKVIVMPCEEGE